MRKSKICLEKMLFYAYHGCLKQERTVGNTYQVDLELTVDLFQAAESDNLNDTINYAIVYELVKEEMAIPSDLLEHVGGRIMERLFHTFPMLHAVKISVYKQKPPIAGDIQRVGIVLYQENE